MSRVRLNTLCGISPLPQISMTQTRATGIESSRTTWMFGALGAAKSACPQLPWHPIGVVDAFRIALAGGERFSTCMADVLAVAGQRGTRAGRSDADHSESWPPTRPCQQI